MNYNNWMKNTIIIDFLKTNALFKDIPFVALQTLANEMSLVHLTSGEYLIHHGESEHAMYLLVQGRLRVHLYNGSEKTGVDEEVGVGEIVGELALLTGMPRAADVIGIRDSTLIKITQNTFRKWFQAYPESAEKMLSDTIKRLLPDALQKTNPVTAIAVLPGAMNVDARAVSRALIKAISPYKKCLLLSEDDVYVREAIRKKEAVALSYLGRCEAEYDLLVYVANPEVDPWTEQCIRQSDQLFMLMPPSCVSPFPSIDYIAHAKHILPQKILLTLHPTDTILPQYTDKLLALTNADKVFHVKSENDYERVGRFIVGKSVSVVFSGGGLRGAAHIGFYLALEENNIPIDMAGGSSFGALAAASVALRLPKEERDAMLQAVHTKLPKLMDYTIPMAAFLRGEKLYDLLTAAFPPQISLEDLWLPTFCAATNVSDADIKIFDRGPAWECIRASMSLPGIFPPVIHDNKVIVDGASFNNLPVDIMRARNGGGKIIASCVSTALSEEDYYTKGKGVSGLDMFLDRFRVQPHTHLPSMFELLVNVGFVASQKHLKQVKPLSDFFVELDVREYSMMDVMHWNQIIQKGYEQGCKLIKELGINRESLGIK